ncbi:protein PET100 homolog, mitochondrial-like [Rhopilema esculentum]|uniref:protein PET100 homolog, mitochondrial-like n=1 Tax=Rhopilema esculentum TaxID=499914 RepID=UPI0031D89F23
MGNRIELFRVGLYVLFPVAIFYYFNLPENQDDYLEKRKREIYPPFEETNVPPKTSEERKKYRELTLNERPSFRANNLSDK